MNQEAMNLDHTAPYFNMSLAACRRADSVGGRRSARNRKMRPGGLEMIEPHLETAHEANMLLDAKFFWLRGVELRTAYRRRSAQAAPRGHQERAAAL
jgi:hypothetical protein